MAPPRDRALWQLYLATFLFSLLMGIGFPLIPQHLQITFGATPAMIGLIMGAHGIMQVILRLPLGDMADRYGRRPSLVATFVMGIGAGLFYVYAPSAWWTLPGQLLFGLSSGMFWVAANAYLFDRVPPEGIPRATSDYGFALGLALLIGPPLGGWIADGWGFQAGLSVFIWASLAGLVLVATLPEVPPADRTARGHVHRRARRIFRNHDIQASALGIFLAGLLFGVLGAFFPVFLRDLRYTASFVGAMIAVRQGMQLLVRPVLPWAIDRAGARKVLLLGLVLAAVGTLFTPWATGVTRLVLVSLITGAGVGALVPANLALVARGSPPKERGLANGIYGTALGLGTMTGPWVLGPVAGRFGLGWAFLGAAGASLIGALILWLLIRRHPTRAALEGPDDERSRLGQGT